MPGFNNILVLISVLLGFLFSLLGLRSGAQLHTLATTTFTQTQGLDQQEDLLLNGLPQRVYYRSENLKNPVLLFLHGGPGFPTSPFARQLEPLLPRHFTVVHWDQRGAGKSYYPNIPIETMTLVQILADTEALIQHLRQRFGQDKIFLVGQSWGSILGLEMAASHPEWLYAYIGVAQIVSPQKGAELGYQLLLARAKQTQNTQALAELKALGPPPHSLVGRQLMRHWQNSLGGFLHQPIATEMAWIGLTSPDYSLEDLWALQEGLAFSNQFLAPEAQKAPAFAEHLKQLQTPIFFLHGRHDLAVPGALSYAFYQNLRAPFKAFDWFENSAHSPNKEEPLRFQKRLIEIKHQVLSP